MISVLKVLDCYAVLVNCGCALQGVLCDHLLGVPVITLGVLCDQHC